MHTLLLLLAPFARAEDVPVSAPARPETGIRGIAGEDGLHTFWSNPALLNFDRDGTAGLYTSWGGDGSSQLAAAAAGGGLGLAAVRNANTEDDASWTFRGAASMRADDTASLGVAVNRTGDLTTWDFGLGLRPRPWLGIGATARELGGADDGVAGTLGVGAAWRPLGDRVTAGVDWLGEGVPGARAHRLEASLRMRPARGTWVRAWAAQGLTDTGDQRVGASLELRAGDMAWGGHGGVDGTARGGAWVTTVRGDDQLMRAHNEVARFALDGNDAYLPVGGLFGDAEEGWIGFLRRVRDASQDGAVRGLVLDIDVAPPSLAHVEELRGIVQTARDAGKPVVAYLREDTGNAAYLLAAGCDRVYLHPAGGLDLVGLQAEVQYLRGAMDMVGVGAQYAKRGQYKSAPEAYTETRSTDPARAQMDALLDDLYAQLVDGIARGRGKNPDEVKALVDGGPYTAAEAVAKGLVDGVAYPDELEARMAEVFPKDHDVVDDYASERDGSGWAPSQVIAIVVVDGVIASGTSSPGGFLSGASTGADTIVAMLDEAREADAVKAVVLRVDSPGGSAFASDAIWRAVARVREAGKPVVVSMGAYAASGGYYVSAGADAIYALPGTVTGSIGIYGGKFNLAGVLDRLDVTTETWTRGRNAGMYSMARPFDEVEYAALDRVIAEGYRQFKEKVEKGRNMSPDKVEEVAQGHVWSGAAAKERGLVDQHGGIFDAVEDARARAGLTEDWSLVIYDPWLGGIDNVAARYVRAMSPQLRTPDAVQAWLDASRVGDERTWAMLPWRLTVR